MLSSMYSGMSSSSERIELSSLASRASGLRLLKSMKFDDERLDADVTPDVDDIESELESWVLFEEVSTEEALISLMSLSF